MIDLQKIAATVGEPDEHRLARRVWYTLAMKRWREDWRKAQATGDHYAMDSLDRRYEQIQGI